MISRLIVQCGLRHRLRNTIVGGRASRLFYSERVAYSPILRHLNIRPLSYTCAVDRTEHTGDSEGYLTVRRVSSKRGGFLKFAQCDIQSPARLAASRPALGAIPREKPRRRKSRVEEYGSMQCQHACGRFYLTACVILFPSVKTSVVNQLSLQNNSLKRLVRQRGAKDTFKKVG
jgi:hypothetical protein